MVGLTQKTAPNVTMDLRIGDISVTLASHSSSPQDVGPRISYTTAMQTPFSLFYMARDSQEVQLSTTLQSGTPLHTHSAVVVVE